jgi:hypothetical protein
MAPLFTEFGAFLKSIGAPAEAAQSAMGLMAKYQATQVAEMVKTQNTAHEAEMKLLGTDADGRIERAMRALETKLSADEAKAIMGATGSAAGVRALEKLLSGQSLTIPTTPAQPAEVDPLVARYPSMRK